MIINTLGTSRSEPAGVRRLLIGQQERPEHQQQNDSGHGDEEDRTPPEVFEQDPTDERAEGHSAYEAGQVDGQGSAALPLVGEHAGDEGQHRRRRAAPISSRFFRPIRSPRVPMVTSSPAIRKP
jgi:hypothetical protein